jgi:hypothetical protein
MAWQRMEIVDHMKNQKLQKKKKKNKSVVQILLKLDHFLCDIMSYYSLLKIFSRIIIYIYIYIYISFHQIY